MLGSPILETGLGLTLVFLLLSLLISAINEIVFGHLTNRRADVLADGLKLLLSGQTTKTDAIVNDRALRLLTDFSGKLLTKTGDGKDMSAAIGEIKKRLTDLTQSTSPTFAEEVLAHPLVLSLRAGNQAAPSYIPTRVFADAVLGTLFKSRLNSNPQFAGSLEELVKAVMELPEADKKAKEILSALLASRRDITEARERIERWFDDAVERIAGTYRRKTQFGLYVSAGLVAVLLNIDSIEITKRLLVDASLRQSLARSAEAAATNAFYRTVSTPHTNISLITNRLVVTGSPAANSILSTNLTVLSTNSLRVVDQLAGDIAALRLPIGWACWESSSDTNRLGNLTSSGLITMATVANPPPMPRTVPEWLLKCLGLLFTVCAISQGAPFWFDLLNRVTNLRAAGVRPVPSTPLAPKQ
jgi:hypothetical protein